MEEKTVKPEKTKYTRKRNVPMIMQMEALECGAACLAMVLAYQGKWIPLEEVREACGISRDGSKASYITRAARGYGLKAKAYSAGIDTLRSKVKYPAILYWNYNHFVVLTGFSRDHAFLNDPAQGKVSVPMEEFRKAYTGICLEFEKGETFEPSGKKESVLAFIRSRLKGTRMLLLLVMLAAGLTTFGTLITPAVSRFFTDQVIGVDGSPWVKALLTAVVLLFIFQLIVSILYAVYLCKIEGKLAVSSNSAFLWHCLKMPMRFFSQRMAGDLASRQMHNDTIAKTLVSKLGPLLINLVMLILYVIIMLRYNLSLTLIGAAAILINVLVARILSRIRVDTTQVRMRDEAKLYAVTASGIDMIESIKASGAENGYFEKLAGYAASSMESEQKEERKSRFLTVLPEFTQSLADIAILMTGVYLIMSGKFSAGMLIAFQGILVRFIAPVNSLISCMQSIQEMRSEMVRVDDVMHYREEDAAFAAYDENAEYSKLKGEIELKDVTFGYSRMAKPLLEHFSMKVKPGQKIAIVGMSGCGKSTITRLIAGLYTPWEGEILFDGKPLSRIPKEVFRGSVLVVDQEITLFADTIGENLKMWDGSIEDFEVILAARDARIHEDIMSRPGGYEHPLREGGRNFSGGQCQRFEIARVLAGDPSILVLDEATSMLDAKTEQEVIQSIAARGLTTIIVAHRLSTIRDSDLILVMENGTVKEQGTHEELMARNGLYTQLITTA